VIKMSLADRLIETIKGFKKEEEYKFFSYPVMKKTQEKGIPLVNEWLESPNKILILEAPTGHHKESIAITSAITGLSKGIIDKVILVVPTVSARMRDSEEIKLILKKWKNQLPKNFLAVIMANKPELCKYKENTKDVYQLCQTIVPKGECLYYKELKRIKPTIDTPNCIDFNDRDDIKKLGNDICPYYLQLSLIKEASLVVCDFNYIIQPILRHRINLLKGKTLIIFNEAHLVPERAMFTNSLRYFTVEKAIREAKEYGIPKEVISELKNVQSAMKKLVGKYSIQIKQDRFEKQGEGAVKISYHEFSKIIDNIDFKIKLFRKYSKEIIYKKFKRNEKSFSSIDLVAGFLETVNKYKDYIINGAPNGRDSKLLWVSENKERENDIGFGMTNTLAFVPLYEIFEQTDKMIFMSATLTEKWLMFMLKLYKWRNLTKFEYIPYQYPKENRVDIVVPNLKIMRSKLRKELLDDVIKEVLDSIKKNKTPIDIITTNGIYNKLKEKLSKKIKVYEIPKGVKSLQKRRIIIEKLQTEPYSTMSPYSWPAVSINIPKVRTAIVLGVNIARMNIIARTIISNYAKILEKQGKDKESAWAQSYTLVMTLTAIMKEEQAVGRFQRSDKDKITIEWVDSRYGKEYLKYIRQYFYGLNNMGI